jgi:hypothetical protein
VLTTQPRGSISTALWNSSYVIFLDAYSTQVAARVSPRTDKLLRPRP